MTAINNSNANTDGRGSAPDFDAKVLEALLDIGGPDMREALSAQLIADFSRLQDGLKSGDAAVMSSAAHELKGLAATVGASRLAEMARSLDGIAKTLPQAARAVMAGALDREITVVLQSLSDAA